MKYKFPKSSEKICGVCYGSGKIHHNTFTDTFSDRFIKDGDCYECHGTGLVIKEMSVDEKLEYLLNIIMKN